MEIESTGNLRIRQLNSWISAQFKSFLFKQLNSLIQQILTQLITGYPNFGILVFAQFLHLLFYDFFGR